MTELIIDLVPAFSRSLKAEGKAPRTIELYVMSVRFWGDWWASEHPGDDPGVDDLTRDSAVRWLESLRDRGQSDGTVRTRWRGMRRFVGWLVAEGILDADPHAGIRVKQPEAPTVPVLSDDDLRALIAACKGTNFRDRRDEVLVRLLLDCGPRVSELCGIRLDDLDLNAGSVLVTGKGDRTRAAYFSSRTGQALDRYMRVRKQHTHSGMPDLLLSQRGPMSADGVRERLNVRAAEAGIDHVHPHQFRHTFAHDFLQAGGSERDLMRLAGWRSADMLSRYGASAADARAAQAARHLARGDRI